MEPAGSRTGWRGSFSDASVGLNLLQAAGPFSRIFAAQLLYLRGTLNFYRLLWQGLHESGQFQRLPEAVLSCIVGSGITQ